MVEWLMRVPRLTQWFSPSGVGARDAAASLSKIFWAKLIRFGQIWLNLAKVRQNLSKIEAKFGQK